MGKKLLIWLLVLPLVLSIYGGFQSWRLDDAWQIYQDLLVEVDKMQSMASSHPDTIVQLDDNEQMPVSQYLTELTDGLAQHQNYSRLLTGQFYLSMSAMLTGVLALLLGGFGIVLCQYSGKRARLSRDDLLKAFSCCRKLLPFILSLQTTLIGIGIMAIMSYEVIWVIQNFKMNAGTGKLLFIALAGIAAIAWYLFKGLLNLRHSFAMFESEPSVVYGQAMSKAAAPQLWQWIDGIAKKMGSDSPDNIIVGMPDCFYVTSHPIALNDSQLIEGKTLYLPLIYTALLSREEATAVIGHELGHFTGEDTTYSLNFAPIYSGLHQSISNVVNQVGDTYGRLIMSSSIYLGIYFLEQFDFAVNHWSRIREFEADKVGASVSSAAAISSALLRISAVDAGINHVFEQAYSGELKTDDLLASVMQYLRETGVPDAQLFLNSATDHPSDSHPQTHQRLASLQEEATAALLSGASRAVPVQDHAHIEHLFVDAQGLSQSLSHDLLQTVATYQAEHQEKLKDIIEQMDTPDAVVLAESRSGFRWMVAFAIMFFMIAIIAVVLAGIASPIVHAVWFGLFFAFLAFKGRERGKAPLLIFHQQHIESPLLAEPYPLHHIADFGLKELSGNLTLTLFLADGAPEPVFSQKRVHFRYNQNKQKMLIIMTGVRFYQGKKLSPEAFAQIVYQQLNVAYAKHELKN